MKVSVCFFFFVKGGKAEYRHYDEWWSWKNEELQSTWELLNFDEVKRLDDAVEHDRNRSTKNVIG